MLTLLKKELSNIFASKGARAILSLTSNAAVKPEQRTGQLNFVSKNGVVPAKSLLHSALTEDALLNAWHRVRQNDGAAGVDGQQIDIFARNVLGRLQQLKSEIERGQYQPQPLMEIDIAKPNKRVRTLCIPSVRDRVLQTAVAQVLGKRLDPEFADISYAYRPQRCSAQAIARVSRLREAGLLYVLDADIEGYFDNINHNRLMSELNVRLNDKAISSLIQLWLTAIVHGKKGHWLMERGIPQGSPLSPLLSNLYLDSFDDALAAKGLRHVRFADDFVVCCATPEDAEKARHFVAAELKKLRLRLHQNKTRLTSFDEGFSFLGVRFTGTLIDAIDPTAAKWVMPRGDHEARAQRDEKQRSGPAEKILESHVAIEPAVHRALLISPDEQNEDVANGFTTSEAADIKLSTSSLGRAAALLQTLYVGEPGAWLTKENDRVIISKDKTVLASVPLGQLDHIAVMSNAMVSTALLTHCTSNRIQIAFSDARHATIVTLDRGSLPDLDLLAAQQKLERNQSQRLTLARQFVEGKIHNQRLILRRYTRHQDRARVEPQIQQINELQAKLASVSEVAQVRGLEGAAAKAYFHALKSLLPEELNFSARVRRPPKDPTNVLLSFGYAVLTHNLHTLLRLSGLNAHFGCLHVSGAGSLALACDLIEEFRAPVVDAVVLTMLRAKEITNTSFVWDHGAELPCRLTPESRRLFVKAIEEKLESRFIHPQLRQPLDYRRAMQAQVQHFARVVLGDDKAYQPLKLR